MLSRLDIEKELGKNINIYPLNFKNFKENSINLCAGYYAWSLGSGTVYYNPSKDAFSTSRDYGFTEAITLSCKKTAIWEHKKNDKRIILLPNSTTLVITKETLAVGPSIGGTYHSKVGIVAQGVGHIGTMLGPNFSGNSLIALHNPTTVPLSIACGESFVSVVFHYLNTPVHGKNPTVSGHFDKLGELGIVPTHHERADICADWRCRIEDVRKKMQGTEDYKKFLEDKKHSHIQELRKFLNWANFIKLIALLMIVLALIFGSNALDKYNNTTEWSNRCWSILGSGVFVTVISGLLRSFKKSDR